MLSKIVTTIALVIALLAPAISKADALPNAHPTGCVKNILAVWRHKWDYTDVAKNAAFASDWATCAAALNAKRGADMNSKHYVAATDGAIEVQLRTAYIGEYVCEWNQTYVYVAEYNDIPSARKHFWTALDVLQKLVKLAEAYGDTPLGTFVSHQSFAIANFAYQASITQSSDAGKLP